jgi:hypothetical protein
MTKKISLTAGAGQDVQFHMPLTYDQITNLQNWQTGHNYQDGLHVQGHDHPHVRPAAIVRARRSATDLF